MGKKYNADAIPDLRTSIPTGDFVAVIESLGDDDPSSSGKYMVVAGFRLQEPPEFINLQHTERFVIGTDTDPSADDPASDAWKSYGARRFRNLLENAGIPLSGDIEADMGAALGQSVGIMLQQSVQEPTNRNGSPNAYAGNLQTQLRRCFHVGEKEPSAKPELQPGGTATAVAASAPAAPKAAPTKPPAAAPKAPAAPAPSAPKPPTATDQVVCPACQQKMTKAAFMDHIKTAHNEE